jgi:hypothetical protein
MAQETEERGLRDKKLVTLRTALIDKSPPNAYCRYR